MIEKQSQASLCHWPKLVLDLVQANNTIQLSTRTQKDASTSELFFTFFFFPSLFFSLFFQVWLFFLLLVFAPLCLFLCFMIFYLTKVPHIRDQTLDISTVEKKYLTKEAVEGIARKNKLNHATHSMTISDPKKNQRSI